MNGLLIVGRIRGWQMSRFMANCVASALSSGDLFKVVNRFHQLAGIIFVGFFFYCFAIDKSELESANYQQLCMRFVCGIEVVDFKKAEVGIKVGVGNVNKSYLTWFYVPNHQILKSSSKI